MAQVSLIKACLMILQLLGFASANNIGCDPGFFRIRDSACMTVFNDTTRNWSAAQEKCKDEQLEMLTHTDDIAVELRLYIVTKYGDFIVWLGAHGDTTAMVWVEGQSVGSVVPPSGPRPRAVVGRTNTLWVMESEGDEVARTQCLALQVDKWWQNRWPAKTYASKPCSYAWAYAACQAPQTIQRVMHGNTDVCHPNPCLNSGACKPGAPDDYHCECLNGFIGKNCQEVLGICYYTNPCEFGVCVETAESYECLCPPGRTGKNCESRDGLCEISEPCVEGVCVNTGDSSYQCYCKSGFSGKHCETKIGVCENLNPCGNNGLCQNEANSYICHCKYGYSGLHCDEYTIDA